MKSCDRWNKSYRTGFSRLILVCHYNIWLASSPDTFLTLSVLGCILSSELCFFFSSISSRLLYSSWLDHSVLCCFCCWSFLSLWTAFRCLNSISCVLSWCLISIWCDRSFCPSNLFISYTGKKVMTMNILLTVLPTFLMALVRRICLNIKTSDPCWSLSLFSSLEWLNR